VVSSVRESMPACQAGAPRTEFKVTALPQISGALSHSLTGHDLFVIALLVLALVAAVVLTAIWSHDKDQRKDAREVFDRIIRWRW
jgi:hypothetical protein